MKTLIIYATKHGFTYEVAKRLQTELGAGTDLANAADTVPALTSYDTVVLGGSVYMGHAQKALTSYINRNQQVLLSKTSGLFLCAGNTDPETQKQELQNAFPPALLAHASAKDVLGYQFSFQKMNLLERTMIRAMRGSSENVSVFFDERIVSFTAQLKKEQNEKPPHAENRT